MSLSAQDILNGLRTRGLRWAVISVVSTIILGVVDQFTSRIIPSVAQQIEDSFDPPKFFIRFKTPVEAPIAVSVGTLGSDPVQPVQVKPRGEGYVAFSGPGPYELRLHRTKEQIEQELVAAVSIEKRDEMWAVDTSDGQWRAAKAVHEQGSATRWTATQEDYALIGSAESFVLRVIAASALAEVGIDEQGTGFEKRRVESYLTAAGLDDPSASPDNPNRHVPWAGAFVAWVAKQAGLELPHGSASFASWLNWGERVELPGAGPGMIALFRGPGHGVHFGGIVLRRHAQCIEVIGGNVARKVVITCVPIERLEGVRRASTE